VSWQEVEAIGIDQFCEVRTMLRQFGRQLVVLIVAGWAGNIAAAQITDTVTVNGKDWAQVDLFIGLAWSDINNVCPGGVCGNSTLMGFDMLGWTWASTEDLNNLFNYYSVNSSNPVPNLLGPGPDYDLTESAGPNSYAQLFFADGWRATSHIFFGSHETMGRTSGSPAYFAGIGLAPSFITPSGISNMAGTNFSDSAWNPGAWFSRPDPAAAIPSPATFTLIPLGLAALGFSRRQRNLQS
jgi:hypothetical protein